jgi:Domain of unknown function (DUF3846)
MTPQPRPAFKAVLIPVGEPPRIVDLPPGTARFLQSLQALCDTSCVQPIQVTSRWQARLADNGIAEGKPVNQAATVLARTYSRPVTLYGPTVITGLRNSGNTAGLSPGQVEAILARTTAAPAT